jgi:hypothetical protein
MSASFLAIMLTLSAGQSNTEPRSRHPLAPSLPELTAKEEAKYQDILERFIQFDTGKLTGAAGKKALEQFNQLPPEAIFILIDGFNRTANMEASCPCVLIGRKIIRILNSSEDLELLAFAKENLGTGVTAKRHRGTVDDVKVSVIVRKGAVQRKLAVAGAGGGVKSMSLGDLVKAADTKQGDQLKAALTEIEKRRGPQVFATLAIAAASPDKETRELGAGLLAKHVARQSEAQLKELLKHERPEVKAAAAKEIGKRGRRLENDLMELLKDNEPSVHQAARAALKELSGGRDFGPEPDASIGEREAAMRAWREWWSKKGR